MGGIGITGFLLIALIALLLFGPSKLPELGRAIGRTLREFKKGASEVVSMDDSSARTEATAAQAPSLVKDTQTSAEVVDKDKQRGLPE